MADCVFVTGARGGCGATTFAFNVALAMASLGERTLYVDGDRELADGLETGGMHGLGVYTLGDAESGACRVKQAILQHPSGVNAYLLPTLGCTDPDYPARAVASCKELFDRVICDGTALSVCTRAAVVTLPYKKYLRAAANKIARLKDGGTESVGLIINAVNYGLVRGGEIAKPSEIAALLKCELWGVIPEDLTLPLCRMRAETGQAYKSCAAVICGSGARPYSGRDCGAIRGAIKRKLRERV